MLGPCFCGRFGSQEAALPGAKLALPSYATHVGAGLCTLGPRPVSGRCPSGGESCWAEERWWKRSAVFGLGGSCRSGFCAKQAEAVQSARCCRLLSAGTPRQTLSLGELSEL